MLVVVCVHRFASVAEVLRAVHTAEPLADDPDHAAITDGRVVKDVLKILYIYPVREEQIRYERTLVLAFRTLSDEGTSWWTRRVPVSGERKRSAILAHLGSGCKKLTRLAITVCQI